MQTSLWCRRETTKLGPDNQTHDAFTPTNFTVYVGETVNLTVYNYDMLAHSITSNALGVSFQIPSAMADGVPSMSHFQFKATASGVFRWWCAVPCDQPTMWAMTTGSDGQMGQLGYMGGYVTVAS